MAKAKKLPSGSWNIRVYIGEENGKKKFRSITAPTKAEAEYQAAVFAKQGKPQKDAPRTVRSVCEEYIKLSEVLSPTTLYEYERTLKSGFQGLMEMNVADLDDIAMQTAINFEAKRPSRYGKPISPKTVKNEYGLISAAMRTICNKEFNVKLPKVQHKNKTLPTPDKVYDLFKGSDIELPVMIAMWLGFSMSEIKGILCSSVDLKNRIISVDNVCVVVGNIDTFKSAAKVDTRIRKATLPEYLVNLIQQQESWKDYKKTKHDQPLVPMKGHCIRNRYYSKLEQAGLTISFHDLRHIFASVMLNKLNIPEKIVQDMGGWSSGSVMKTVYSNTFTDSRIQAENLRDEYFNSIVETNS